MSKRFLTVLMTATVLALLSLGAVNEARAMFSSADATAVKQMGVRITIVNNTPFIIRLVLICPNGAQPIVVPPNSVVVINLPPECLLAILVCGGQRFVPMGGGCQHNVNLGGGCADVCYDPVSNTLTANPTAGPCPCD